MKASQAPHPAAFHLSDEEGYAPPSSMSAATNMPRQKPAIYSPMSDPSPSVAGTALEPKVMRGLDNGIRTANRALRALEAGGPRVDKVLRDYFGADGASARVKREVGGYAKSAAAELGRHRDQRGANIIPYDPKTRGGWQGAGAFVNGDPKHQIHVSPAGMAGVDEPTGRMLLHEATHFSGAKDTKNGYLDEKNRTGKQPEDPVHNADSLAFAMGALAQAAAPDAGDAPGSQQGPEPSTRPAPGPTPAPASMAGNGRPSSSPSTGPGAGNGRPRMSPATEGSAASDRTDPSGDSRPERSAAPEDASSACAKGRQGGAGRSAPSGPQAPGSSGASGTQQQAQTAPQTGSPPAAPDAGSDSDSNSDGRKSIQALAQTLLSFFSKNPGLLQALTKDPSLMNKVLAQVMSAIGQGDPAGGGGTQPTGADADADTTAEA